MTWYLFAIRLVVAVFLGALVGAERQWRQRTAGLRTNCLVAVGSAMFVMMGGLIGGDGSQGRVAAYIVSGIGFLGGGVILKDVFSIRGLNTAATLWCTAAIGTLWPWLCDLYFPRYDSDSCCESSASSAGSADQSHSPASPG